MIMFSNTNKLFGKPEKNMDSELKIVWTQRAKTTYSIVLDYLVDNWSKREIIQFMNRVELVIQAIRQNPEIFPASTQNKRIRRTIVDKNNSFFYSADRDMNRLTILTFYDQSQNPSVYEIDQKI